MDINWQVWLTLIIMLIGIAGTVLPFLPGLVLIFCAALGYGLYDQFLHISPYVIVVLGLLTALGTGVEYFSGVVGAKYTGASKTGSLGALLGGILGIFFFPWGIILFPPLGVVLGELAVGKNPTQAWRAAWGTCLGLLGGALTKIIISFLMVAIFVWDLAV